MGFKEDTLLKQWMDREKVAVDYGRLCDKRIAELERQISEQQAIHTSAASKTGLEQQRVVTESIKELSAEIKQWMNREKAAVDYGRLCDKRIAELERQISERQAIQTSAASKTGLEQQRVVSESIKVLSAEIKELRAQLSHAKTPSKERSEYALTKMRVLRLEAVMETAKAGLEEELRIAKKPESTLQDSILVKDGEDLIPARWLELKRALQPLPSTTASLKAKRA